MMNLENKTILITGASKGIGLELSKLLDSEGADLILVGRSFLEKPFTNKHVYIEADLLTAKGINTIKKAIKHLSIDILCNVAGIGVYKSLEELTAKELGDSMRVNTIAPFELIKLTYEKLKVSEIGLVLNVGSGAGTMPFKNRSAYCASKYEPEIVLYPGDIGFGKWEKSK